MKRLKSVSIAPLVTPKEGLFGGRHIPKERLSNPAWVDLFNAEEPPEDGLYVSRKIIVEPATMKKQARKARKNLPLVALFRAVKIAIQNQPVGKKVAKKQEQPDWSDLHIDWNELSPDLETELLGLEQLERDQTIAIVGAGISGLTLAWILNRARPDLKIHVYDSQDKVGGWMRSEQIKPNVIFESGPRTLLPSHPGTKVLTGILNAIDQSSKIVGVPSNSPTNTKGLVYNKKIVQLPSSLGEAISFITSSAILKGLKFSMFAEIFRKARDRSINDESVASFVSRRFNPKVNDRLISAIFRGIYGADTAKLSARSVARFSRLYYLERTQDMSILTAALTGSLSYVDSYAKDVYPLLFQALTVPARAKEITKTEEKGKFSLFSFVDGIQSLPEAIENDLRQRRNVVFHLGTKVENISAGPLNATLKVDGKDTDVDMVVSTIAKPELVESEQLKSLLGSLNYSSLAVVNIHTPEPIAKDWFGILVPKSEDSWNKDGVLGIIFDSSVRKSSVPVFDGPNEQTDLKPEGSTLTMMLGGDLWTDMTQEQAEEKALNSLETLLGPFDRSLVTTKVTLQKNCIPRYEPGHSDTVQAIHEETSDVFHNRVAFTGMALGRGVGISDAALDSLLLATRFTNQRKLLYPRFFFGEYYMKTRPNYFA